MALCREAQWFSHRQREITRYHSKNTRIRRFASIIPLTLHTKRIPLPPHFLQVPHAMPQSPQGGVTVKSCLRAFIFRITFHCGLVLHFLRWFLRCPVLCGVYIVVLVLGVSSWIHKVTR